MTAAELQYIGVCALLARITSRSHINRELYDEDRDSIELALQEAANTFPGRFEVIRVGHGGFSLEPIMPSTRAGSQQST